MNGTQKELQEEVDYFIVDVDKPGARELMDQLGARTRSTYILLDSSGEEIWRFVGPISSQSEMVAGIRAAIAETNN